MARIGDEIENSLTKILKGGFVAEVIAEAKPEIVKELVEEFGILPKQKINLDFGDTEKTIAGTYHKEFAQLLKLIKIGVPTFLYGPAGTGKNYLIKQCADALDLEFYFSNAVTNEYKLTGFIDAHGNYQKTQFFDAFSTGGLFMLDEIDASVPEVLVILNAAIANGYFDFPGGRVDAHPKFRVVAAGNTMGSGATRQYVGRFQIDAATLDRFVMVNIGYDNNVEAAICPDMKLCSFVQRVRAAVKKTDIRMVVSYRATNQLHKMVNVAGIPMDIALKQGLIKATGRDDMKMVVGAMEKTDTDWDVALQNMCKVE